MPIERSFLFVFCFFSNPAVAMHLAHKPLNARVGGSCHPIALDYFYFLFYHNRGSGLGLTNAFETRVRVLPCYKYKYGTTRRYDVIMPSIMAPLLAQFMPFFVQYFHSQIILKSSACAMGSRSYENQLQKALASINKAERPDFQLIRQFIKLVRH